MGNKTYLRCVLTKKGCKGTSILNNESNLVTPKSPHNHMAEEYNSEVHELRAKCKKMAQRKQGSLRKIFDDTTRNSLYASVISFYEVESSMYRARRRMQPKIPLTADEFSQVLPGSSFDQHHKFTVLIDNNTAVVFASQKMVNLLSEVIHIQFDGTFYTVPLQFYQIWTIFVTVGTKSFPAIHCLMNSKV